MLEIKDLCFSYGERKVLRGVSLSAQPGELVFVLGANGAGKTTLFRCILGLLHGYTGDIQIDGVSASSLTARELAQRVAYIPQSYHPVFPYTVLDMVLMGTNHRLSTFSSPGKKEHKIAMDALQMLGIESYADRNFQRLSGGEQQLVLVARALAQQAKILLMDEPTSALDFGNQVRVLERVAALAWQGYTILLSCHNPQHAMLYAQRVVAILDGKVAADGPPRSAVTAELMQRLYNVPARFVETDDGVLIAPVRKSMFRWTPDIIRFREDAARINGAYDALADQLRAILPTGGRLCDAGCGIGCLSLALSGDFAQVTAADLSAQALDALRRRNSFSNVVLRQCDVLNDCPDQPYDAMVFCFFGSADEILQTAKAQCSGTVAVIKKVGDQHRFTPSGKPRDQKNTFGTLCRAMDERGVPCKTKTVELDMGQPFRSLSDAVLFFRTYSHDDESGLTEEQVERLLEKRDDEEFPWYLPSTEEVGILWFRVADLQSDTPQIKGENDMQTEKFSPAIPANGKEKPRKKGVEQK